MGGHNLTGKTSTNLRYSTNQENACFINKAFFIRTKNEPSQKHSR